MNNNIRLASLLALLATPLLSSEAVAQPKPQPFHEDLSYFMPSQLYQYTLDGKIPTPKQVLGFEAGQQMVLWEQVINYMEKLAAASPRFSIKEYGRTHENRPLVCVAITSPENQKKLDEIQRLHGSMADPNAKVDIDNLPVVVEIMESIHGNEASGVNSSLPFAYFWAAAQGKEIEDLLQKTVILLVPGQNPDGINRFATWANSHRSLKNNTDPQSMEFHETFPGGRSNHYWFDLNRDWINATQPEMKALLQIYHDWMPNVMDDHHEQGRDSYFFMEPSDPVAYYPYIPQENKDLTDSISKYNVKALDAIGSLYFSRDSYDSYSLGTGDVYEDALGSIGMLFEQPSSRGHQQESTNGILSFPFTMRNHLITAMGSVKASYEMRNTLNDYMKRFVADRYTEAQKNAIKGWVFDGNGSEAHAYHFIEMMRQHRISVNKLAKDITQNGHTYKAENSYVISEVQRNSVLLRSLFDSNKQFVDSLFYDVSTWNMAEAYGLNYSELKNTTGLMGDDATQLTFKAGEVKGGKSQVAYLFDIKELYTPYVVNGLQEAGIRVMVTASGAKATDGSYTFGPGSLIVPVRSQKVSADSIYTVISKLAKDGGVQVQSVGTSRMTDFDLGHYTNSSLRQAKIAIVAGGRDTGTPWYILNYRMQMTPTILDDATLSQQDLSKYNVIIITSALRDKKASEKIAEWVRNGGELITFGDAYKTANDNKLSDIKTKTLEKPDSTTYINYADRRDRFSMYEIPGTTLQVQMDYTHPLCWGYSTPMPLMKHTKLVFEQPKEINNAPVWFDKKDPLLSGYLRDAHKKPLTGAPEVIVNKAGKGIVISFADDINFRSTWYASTRMFLNAILFGDKI